MASLWSVSKALHIPFDKRLENLEDLPYTISYIVRKLTQVDSFMELPKEKRPPDELIWEGSSRELNDFIDRVFNRKEKQTVDLVINEDEVE